MHRATLDWKSKLHPAFIEMADVYKEFSLALAMTLAQAKSEERGLGRKITSEDKLRIAKRVIAKRDELVQRFDKEIVDIDSRYKPLPASTLCFPYMTELGQEDQSAETESRTFAEWLHWERHHESLQNAAEADEQGDMSAWDRIARTAKRLAHYCFQERCDQAVSGRHLSSGHFSVRLVIRVRNGKAHWRRACGFFRFCSVHARKSTMRVLYKNNSRD